MYKNNNKMSRIIRFSRKKMFRNVNLIGLSIIILGIVLSFIFRDFPEIVFFSFAVIFSIFVLLLSYKIRYFPNIIVLDEDKILIEYMSKSFFKQKSFSGNIEDIDIEKIKNKIILSKQNQTIAVIINTSVSKEDEEFLFSVYKKVHANTE